MYGHITYETIYENHQYSRTLISFVGYVNECSEIVKIKFGFISSSYMGIHFENSTPSSLKIYQRLSYYKSYLSIAIHI